MHAVTDNAFTPEELARRRRAASRWAWLIGALVVALYIGGLFVKR